jgi:Protein of unknown function (DUF1393).
MKTKNVVLTGLCMALGVALPMAFHAIPNAGNILLPMHIPVLLCGFLCGWQYGAFCGMLTPVLSSLLTGMPPAAILPGMVVELATYGLLTGLFMQHLPVRKNISHIYASLLCAMLTGRVAYGIMNALIFRAGAYSLQLWLTASFVTALPGIAVQLTVIPLIILTLQKAKIVSPTTAA